MAKKTPSPVEPDPEPVATPIRESAPAVQGELGRLQAQISTRRLTLTDLDRQIGQRQQELARAEKTTGERLAGTRERLGEAEAALAQAHAELDDTNRTAATAEKARRKSQAKLDELKTGLAEAEARRTVIEEQIRSEAAVESRVGELREALDAHERAADAQLASLEAIKAEEARVSGIIANAQEAHARRMKALQEREDASTADTATLAHNTQLLQQYAEELEQRHLDLEARESGLVTARNDAETAFNQIRADRQELTAEKTRLDQMRQALDVVGDEATKTHQAAQEARATADQARSEADALREAQTARSEQTEAAWLEVRNAERGLAQRTADLDAREKRLRTVSLKLAGSAAELKQAITRQKLEGAGIVVPDVEV